MIHLADNYYIDADKFSFMLCEETEIRSGANKGKKTISPISHHATKDQLIRAIMDLALKEAINEKFMDCVKLVENTIHAFEKIQKLKR